MKYEFAPDIQEIAQDISKVFFDYIKLDRVKCFRSYGTSTKRTIARCHALGKLMQKAIGIDAYYVLEFLTEQFEKLKEEDKIKTIIHELMHIPKTFGGGFRQHDYVCEKNVEKIYRAYVLFKEKEKIKYEEKNFIEF